MCGTSIILEVVSTSYLLVLAAFKAAELNRLLRAVDENEDFYNVDNYANNTPGDMVATFKKMQEGKIKSPDDIRRALHTYPMKVPDPNNIQLKKGIRLKRRLFVIHNILMVMLTATLMDSTI